MHDDTDDGLVDVGGITLSELSNEMEETALEHALRRILAASVEHERHNFQAII
jgi:FXSXX-COOH protein